MNFLCVRDIQFKARQARLHNKIRLCKFVTLKEKICKLDTNNTTKPKETIVARAKFLYDMFSDSRLMSSFELARW